MARNKDSEVSSVLPTPSEIATYTPSTITQPSSPVTSVTPRAVQTATAQLTARGGSGSGTAIRNFDGLTYEFTVNATLPTTTGTATYEVWLTDPTARTSPMLLGTLEKQGAIYMLRYSSTANAGTYSNISVTRQIATPGSSPTPGVPVLTGTFASS